MAVVRPDPPEEIASGVPVRRQLAPSPADPHARPDRLASLVGMCVGSVAGILYGAILVQNVRGPLDTWQGAVVTLAMSLGLGCVVGYILGPNLSVRPYFWAEEQLATLPFSELIGLLVGILVALAIAALVALIASGLPYGLGWMVAVVVAAVLVPLGLSVGRRRRRDISLMGLPMGASGPPLAKVVVDTSAVIDGRLLDLARAGFCLYQLVIPQFVLDELQAVADSGDPVRRARGRRGIAMLEELRSLSGLDLSFPQIDYPSMPEVDARLVRLAREEGAGIFTVDFNLDRLAQIAGLRVLNLNQLATALRPALVAGERLEVDVVKEGREPEQGVGYLEDGTMLVVEGGQVHLGERVEVTVRSVIQTASGRMVFTQFESRCEATPPARRGGRRQRPAGSGGH
ncbi:MAG: TRAM domain-containing protein [Candidatus Dormibacteria bacterium]